MEWIVYGLTSSLDEEIRYIGITNDLRRRFSHHVNGACRETTWKARWIKSVQSRDGHIVVKELARGLSQIEAKRVEVQLIAAMRSAGRRLTNLTDGGDGTVGRRHTLEARKKMAAAATGRSANAETKRKMSDAKKGKPSGRAGLPQPAKVKRKISATLKVVMADPIVRDRISAGLRDRYETSELRQEVSFAVRKSPPTSRNTSGFKGVSLCRRTGRWVAQIKIEKQTYLGRFNTAEEAARAYDAAAKAAWGEDCYLNFR